MSTVGVVMVSVYVFIIGGVSLVCNKEHILSMLLSLEMMALSIFIVLSSLSSSGGWYVAMVYLIFAACEGALGLGVLVIFSRSEGGDHLGVVKMSLW